MKRLTMHRVAKAGLIHNKKAYVSLTIAIFLAVYLVCTAALCISGTLEAEKEQMARRVGYADVMQFNAARDADITDDDLRRSGLFERIGRVYVTASVNDTEEFCGYYDQTAEALMNRRCEQGRLPQAPGEIAAERSALDKLSLENAAVGDVFTWSMTPFDGSAEERVYTLVGILTEQSAYLDPSAWFNAANGTVRLPSVLTSKDEPAYSIGRATFHRVMTLSRTASFKAVEAYDDMRLSLLTYVSRVFGCAYPYDVRADEAKTQATQVTFWLILGGALLLTACVGIASATESMLAQKTEDIGMMRAVGATRRQIKRLYRRDAWLLTAIALPAGILPGCLTAWLVSRLIPEDMLFCPSVWLLLPTAAVTALCVYLSSALPLRRASRLMPVSVLRDTASLRRAARIRSRKTYGGTRLIASRQFLLHPMRHAGGACMTALMLTVAVLLFEMLLNSGVRGMRYDNAFTLTNEHRQSIQYEPFVQAEYENTGLTQNDAAQLRALPTVTRLNMRRQVTALLTLPSDIPDYFKAHSVPVVHANGYTSFMDFNAFGGATDTRYLDVTDTTTQADFADEWQYQTAMNEYAQMRMLQKSLGLTQKIVPISVIIATLEKADFDGVVMQGNIDIAALDAGREVLVFAPSMYVKRNADGSIRQSNDSNAETRAQWDLIIKNNYFKVGRTLPMLQLFGKVPDGMAIRTDEAVMQRYYDEAARVDFSPTVGAVITSNIRIGDLWPFGACVITTEKGAQALSLKSNGAAYVGISLSQDPDADTEELLQNAVTRIGMRRDMTITNYLSAQREQIARERLMISLFAGMVLLFFAVSVSMQVTSAARRIRADERMVGTLRAVGADERALTACYRLPTVIASGVGCLLAWAAYLTMIFINPVGFPQYHPWLLALAALMAALNALCAAAGIRRQMRRVMRKSIIQNIREL